VEVKVKMKINIHIQFENGFPALVKMANGKRGSLLCLREAYVQAHTAAILTMQPMGSLPISLHSSSSRSSSGALEFVI
jgi:hypothetical protein